MGGDHAMRRLPCIPENKKPQTSSADQGRERRWELASLSI